MSATRPDDERRGSAPGRWRALAVCLVGGFMVLLDVSIVNVALPSIRAGLHATESDLQWVVSGYALTFGLVLVPGGRLGDMRGRRTLFMAALALFAGSSAACGAAPTSAWLVFARLAQGVAGGLLTPQITALIQEMFAGRERGVAFGIFGSVVRISTAVGPLIGGLLIQAFGTDLGWRFVFFVNVPIGVAAIPFAAALLPAAGERRRHDLDLPGVLLLGAGIGTLLLPLVQAQQWHGLLKWLLVPLAAALLAGFVRWDARYQHRGREALVDLRLFRLRSYAFGIGMITLYFAGFTPLFFVFTLFVQNGLSYSALLAGVAILPFAVGSGASAWLGGRLIHRHGRKVVAAGLVLVAIGLVGTVLAVGEVPGRGAGWATLVPLLVAGTGSGLVISPNQALTLSAVPVEQAGAAGGLLQTGQRVGAAIGIAAAGSVFFARVSATHGQGWDDAYRDGLLVATAFVAAALLVALVDLVVDRALARGPQFDQRWTSPEPGGTLDGTQP